MDYLPFPILGFMKELRWMISKLNFSLFSLLALFLGIYFHIYFLGNT
jgi:hypothetical protein